MNGSTKSSTRITVVCFFVVMTAVAMVDIFVVMYPRIRQKKTDTSTAKLVLDLQSNPRIFSDGLTVAGASGHVAKMTLQKYNPSESDLMKSYHDHKSDTALRVNIAYLLIAAESDRYLQYILSREETIPKEEKALWHWYVYNPKDLSISRSYASSLAEVYIDNLILDLKHGHQRGVYVDTFLQPSKVRAMLSQCSEKCRNGLFEAYIKYQASVSARVNIAYLLISDENEKYLRYIEQSARAAPPEEIELWYAFGCDPEIFTISEKYAKELLRVHEQEKHGTSRRILRDQEDRIR